MLRNVFSLEIFRKASENIKADVIFNSQVENNFGYADDSVILATSLEGMKRMQKHFIK